MGASREVELAGLWRSLAANEAAIQRVFDEAHLGTTPDDMAQVFVAEVRRRGIGGRISGHAFVVGEGGRGPKLVLKRALQEGDLWGMDFQFTCDGFYSDIGRYAVFGEPSADLLERHARVLETQQMIAEAIRPRHPIGEAFEKCPPGSAWTIEVHRIGQDLHMDPAFSTMHRDNNKLDTIVPVGIVLCVEIWAGFDGGVEDEYLVAEDGLRRLTTLPRELVNTAKR